MTASAAPLPGDDVVPAAQAAFDRGTTYDAAASDVWPWLVQLGKSRAGWYLPTNVERLVPKSRRALRVIDPRWQQLAVGDVVPDWGGAGATFTVDSIRPPGDGPRSWIVYRSTRPRRGDREPLHLSWALVLDDIDGFTSRPGSELRLRLRIDRLGRRLPGVTTWGADQFDRLTVVGMFAGLRERLTR